MFVYPSNATPSGEMLPSGALSASAFASKEQQSGRSQQTELHLQGSRDTLSKSAREAGGRSARVLTPPLELPQSALVTLNYTTRVPVAGFLHLLWCSERSAWIRIPQHSGKWSHV